MDEVFTGYRTYFLFGGAYRGCGSQVVLGGQQTEKEYHLYANSATIYRSKSRNILLPIFQSKFIDFGVAKQYNENSSLRNTMVVSIVVE